MGTRNEEGREGKERSLEHQTATFIGWTPNSPTWPTPDGQVFQDGHEATLEEWEERRKRLKENAKTPNGNGCGTPLAMAANLWSTPNAKCAEDSQTHRSGERSEELLLTGQARQWATPRNADHKGACQATETTRRRPASGQANLPEQAQEAWATPTASPWRSGEASQETLDRNARPLNEQVTSLSSLPVPATETAGPQSSPAGPTSRRRLSPAFVCWLMGMPSPLWTNPGWTSFGRAGMESWLCRQRARLSNFVDG